MYNMNPDLNKLINNIAIKYISKKFLQMQTVPLLKVVEGQGETQADP